MKGSMLMGTQHNKLGNMVYYRRRGQEVARAKVTPANPRSERQARQRMNFGTLQHAKSRLAEIVDHSFQGVAYGDISLNHFTKLNVPLLMYAAANPSENAAYFIPKGVKGLAPNEYIVSDGSLQKLAQTWDSANDSILLTGATMSNIMRGPDDYISQLATLGFAPGDQLTVMQLVNTGAVIATTPAGDSIYDVQLAVKRVVFKTVAEVDDWTGIESLWVSGDQADHYKVNPALLVAEKSDDITFFNGAGIPSGSVGVFLDATPWGASAQSVAGVIIRSSLVAGQWLRSPQTLLVFDDGESRPSVADVLSTYMDTTTDPESPYYLNQSQARNVQSTGITPVITNIYSQDGAYTENTKTWEVRTGDEYTLFVSMSPTGDYYTGVSLNVVTGNPELLSSIAIGQSEGGFAIITGSGITTGAITVDMVLQGNVIGRLSIIVAAA